MEYKINGRQITLFDNKYWIFSGELNNYNLEQLNEAIENIENVFKGHYQASSFFGDVVFTVEFDNEMSRIAYYDELVCEEPTIEIYNMLKDYRAKLIEYIEAKDI